MNKLLINEANYKWWGLMALLIGTFSVALSLSLLFSATPRIMVDLGVDVTQVAWLSIAYALSFTVLQPIWGRLADLHGRKRFFIGGLAVFTLGAALCATSWDLISMAAFRFLQGIGAAAVFPVGMAFIGDTFPAEQRGRAMGIWGIAGGAAPAIGPTLGGLILDFSGWRTIYWFSVVIGILSLAIPLWLLRESARPGKVRVDYAGSVALFISVGTLLLAVSQGRTWGWTSALTLGLTSVSLLTLAILISIEKNSPAPVIDLALVRSRLFAPAALAAFVSFAALQGTLFLLPFYLINVQGYSGSIVGLLLLPFFLPMALASPLAGWLTDRWGARWVAVTGMTLSMLALVFLSQISHNTPYWVIATMALALGVGIAMALPPLGKVIVGAVTRPKVGAASGLFSMVRSLGGPFGVAILGSIFAARAAHYTSALLSDLGPQLARLYGMTHAFDEAFLLAAGISALGVMFAFLIPETWAHQEVIWSRQAWATLQRFPPEFGARAQRGLEVAASRTGMKVVTPELALGVARSWKSRQSEPQKPQL